VYALYILWRLVIIWRLSIASSILLYGAGTWRTTKTALQKIQTFYNTCLRRSFNIRWPERITNKDLWRLAKQDPIDMQIRRRKWGWIGHTLRKPPSNTTRQAITWNTQGKRKRGRPRNIWWEDTETELKEHDTTWKEEAKAAQNCVRWRIVIDGLCSSWNDRPK
jgi:hypothetical protein